MNVRKLQVALIASLLTSACITVAPPPEDEGLPSAPAYDALPANAATGSQGEPFVGLELAEATSGGLDALEFLAGLRVANVAPGSPAEAAGLRAGDRVLSVDGMKLERLDQWSALLASVAPGRTWRIEAERDGNVRAATLEVRQRSTPELRATDRFVERRRLRCTASTVALGAAASGTGAARTGARLDELADDSPLHDAGIEPGDTLLALDGKALTGAADLFTRVAAMAPGSEVELVVQSRDGGERQVDLDLYEPERHLTALRLWPLLAWSKTPDERRSEVVVIDLWLIWLYKRTHDGPTTQTSVLRFISWESGVGALTEDGTDAGAAGGGR